MKDFDVINLIEDIKDKYNILFDQIRKLYNTIFFEDEEGISENDAMRYVWLLNEEVGLSEYLVSSIGECMDKYSSFEKIEDKTELEKLNNLVSLTIDDVNEELEDR